MKKISKEEAAQNGTPDIEATNVTTEDDKFNIDSLRLSQNFSESLGVKKALLTVPVRRPNKQDFFKVRREPEYRLETVIIELKEEGTTYLVDRSLWLDIPGELVPKILFTTINRQGVLALWPVRLPDEAGRQDNWSRSELKAADMAKDRWIRMTSNRSLGAYEVVVAPSDIPEPEWPDVSFKEILEIAFRDQFIDSLDHPVLRRLRGLA